MFRLGFIQPMRGTTSATRLEIVGRAMLKVAREGWPEPILENKDLRAAGLPG